MSLLVEQETTIGLNLGWVFFSRFLGELTLKNMVIFGYLPRCTHKHVVFLANGQLTVLLGRR